MNSMIGDMQRAMRRTALLPFSFSGTVRVSSLEEILGLPLSRLVALPFSSLVPDLFSGPSVVPHFPSVLSPYYTVTPSLSLFLALFQIPSLSLSLSLPLPLSLFLSTDDGM